MVVDLVATEESTRHDDCLDVVVVVVIVRFVCNSIRCCDFQFLEEHDVDVVVAQHRNLAIG
jgi:hypothetical protein